MEEIYDYSDGNIDGELDGFFMATVGHPIHDAGKLVSECRFSESDNALCARQSQIYREFKEDLGQIGSELGLLSASMYESGAQQPYERCLANAVWFVQRAYFVMRHAYENLHEAEEIASAYYDSGDWRRQSNAFTKYDAFGGMSDEYREQFFREYRDGVRALRDRDGGLLLCVCEFAEFLGMDDSELDNF